MTNLTIRPMTSEDIPIVAEWMVQIPLWQRYRVTLAAAQSQFKHGLAQQEMLLVADALSLHRAVGFTWCLPKGGFGLSAYLKLIGVHPDQTGSGIGAALLTETERMAFAHGSSEMFLLTSDFNSAAQRFYRRQGYEQIGRIPAYILPGVAELIFWKRLLSLD